VENSPKTLSGISDTTETSSAGDLAFNHAPGIQSQVRLVILIALSVFFAEALVMMVISFLPSFSKWFHAIFDATLLIILLSPVLYFGLFRTLVRHISERKRAEEQLKQHRDHLDVLVAERTAELTAANQKLEQEVLDRRRAEWALNERVKELNCLYGITALREKAGLSLMQILQGVIELLPPSWQYPDITSARIVLDSDEFVSGNFHETQWKQASDIIVNGKSIGAVEVFYLKAKPQLDEGPFLKEERSLIDAVADLLGGIVEKIKIEEELKRELEMNAALSELYKPLISPSASIEDIAYTVLGKAKSLTNSEHGYVSSIDPVGGDMVVHTHTEMLKDQCRLTGENRRLVFQPEKDGRYSSLWGHALNTLKSFYSNSPATHKASKGAPEGHIPIDRFLSIPVTLGHELVGQIALANKGEDYAEQDLQAIGRVAEFYALAIQRNRVEERLQEAKDELEERVRERTAELQRANQKLKTEIEERIRFQEQLEHSKSMLQAVVDGISDPLVLIDKDMRVKMLNSSAADYYGVSEYQEIIGSSCHQVLRRKFVPCQGCEVPGIIKSGKSMMFERTGFMDPDRLEHVFVYPVKGKAGQDEDVLLRIGDITEQRMFEKHIIQSEKLASLGVLVSSIAHEINNPNSFISFNIPILKDYIKDLMPIVDTYAATHPNLEIGHMAYPEFRKDISNLLDNIAHGSERINSFVSNLKEFSQVKDKVAEDWIDLNSVIEKVLSICGIQLKKNVNSFITNIPVNLPRIWSDPSALEQILLNLLVNAAQASDKKDSRVELNAKIRDSWSDHTIFEVKDNGCGLDQKALKNIFDPFFTTKSDTGGTGLGLYVTHNLVESLRGRIEVESEPGNGSTFRVVLPDKERRQQPRA
jgi:C4-dicarboxylate-specific signal transduction histidine kinase